MEVSPSDAERIGLKESQQVVVRLRDERLERIVKIRPSVREGTVYISDFKVCAASLEVK